MAKITVAEQALLDLQKVQTRLLVLGTAANTYTPEDAIAMSDMIDTAVKTLRSTLARTAQALRGELN